MIATAVGERTGGCGITQLGCLGLERLHHQGPVRARVFSCHLESQRTALSVPSGRVRGTRPELPGSTGVPSCL